MKTCPHLTSLTVALCSVVLIFLLAACSGAAPTPAPVDTVGEPTGAQVQPTSTSAPPTLAPPTSAPPSATASLPTLPAASPTPPPATTLPPPTQTQASAPIPTLSDQPIAGVWTGGGARLLIDFMIQTQEGVTTLSNVGLVWQGHDECDLNGRFKVSAPLNENGFVVHYSSDEVTFVLSGAPVSSTVIEGLLNLKVEGCGSQQLTWRAIPKTNPTP